MKFLDEVRHVLRVRHYSYRTEQCYVAWITHYVRFAKGDGPWRHPGQLTAVDVERFLAHLAVDRHVSASTQNQALNALVFLDKAVLHIDLGDFHAVRPFAADTCPRCSPGRRSTPCSTGSTPTPARSPTPSWPA